MGINRVMLIGYVGRPAYEDRPTPTLRFRMTIPVIIADHKREDAVDVKLQRDLAYAHRSLAPGAQVYVEGAIVTTLEGRAEILATSCQLVSEAG